MEGQRQTLAGKEPQALVADLTQAGLPLEALLSVNTALYRALLAAAGPGALSATAKIRLRDGLRLQSSGLPALAAWTDALEPLVRTREDLEAVIAFVEAAALEMARGR